MIELDHISLGVRNLYDGAHRLRAEHGLDSYEGGSFPGIGIGQRVVPLPERVYIEIESVIDPVEGAATPIGQWFGEATRDDDAWMFWCLRATTMDEMEAVAARLGRTVNPMRPGRVLPNGQSVGTLLVTGDPAGFEDGLPTYYYWEDLEHHPSTKPVEHHHTFTSIERLEFGGDPQLMEDYLTTEVFERLPLHFIDAPPGLHALVLGLDDGREVTVRKPSAAPLCPMGQPSGVG